MPRETATARARRRRREQIVERANARRAFEALPQSERLQILHDDICAHADEIAALFNCPMKITILARSPDNPEREVLITGDAWEGIEAAILRAKGREAPARVCVNCGHLERYHNPGGCAGGCGAGGALSFGELPCTCAYLVGR